MKISEIEGASPEWMQYLPIQSVRQVVSVVLCYALVISAFSLLRPDDDVGSWWFLYLGVAIGSIPSLVLALPQIFRIEFSSFESIDSVLNRIDESLVFRGYRRIDEGAGFDIRYASKLPPILSWKENEFTVRGDRGMLVIRGPRSSIAWLRKRLIGGIG